MTDPVPFEIEQDANDDGTVVVSVRGELDLATAPELETALRPHKDAGTPVVLEIGGLGFMDSSGLNLLIRTVAEARESGWELRIDPTLADPVARLLEVTGMRDELPWVTAS